MDQYLSYFQKLLYIELTFQSAFSAFNFAFDLAKTAMTSKLPDIYLKRAMHLEDEVNDSLYA